MRRGMGMRGSRWRRRAMLRWRLVLRRVSDCLGYGEGVLWGGDGKVGWHSEGVSWEEANTFDRGKFN